MEGATEDSEKAHKRLRKRGQHKKHRSALRALKNTPLSAVNYFSRALGYNKSLGKKPPKTSDVNYGHKKYPPKCSELFSAASG